MEKEIISELKTANSKLEDSMRELKELNIYLEINKQIREHSIRKNELLIKQNGKNINYLTAHINYGFIL